jgi:VanZ family protein
MVRLPIVLYCLLIYGLSSIPGFPPSFSVLPDKLAHMVLYGGLGFLFARYLHISKGFSFGYISVFTFLFCCAYGITDEIHQYFVPGREAEVGDVIADAVGGLFGSISYLCYIKYVYPRFVNAMNSR